MQGEDMKHSKPRFFVREDTLFMDGKPVHVARSLILICLVADGYPDLPETPIRLGTALRILRLKRSQVFLEKLEEDEVSLSTMYELDEAGGAELTRGNEHPRSSRRKPQDN
jgi:hypothetical protein